MNRRSELFRQSKVKVAEVFINDSRLVRRAKTVATGARTTILEPNALLSS